MLGKGALMLSFFYLPWNRAMLNETEEDVVM